MYSISGFSLATSSCVTSLPFSKSFIDLDSSASKRRRKLANSSSGCIVTSPMASCSAKDTGDFKTDPLPSALHRQERAVIIIDCHLVVVMLFRLRWRLRLGTATAYSISDRRISARHSRQASAEHFQQNAEFPPLRNRSLGPLAMAVLPIPFARCAHRLIPITRTD